MIDTNEHQNVLTSKTWALLKQIKFLLFYCDFFKFYLENANHDKWNREFASF